MWDRTQCESFYMASLIKSQEEENVTAKAALAQHGEDTCHSHEDQDYVLLLHQCWDCSCSKYFTHLTHIYKYVIVRKYQTKSLDKSFLFTNITFLHFKLVIFVNVQYEINCIFSIATNSGFAWEVCLCFYSVINDSWFNILWSNAVILIIIIIIDYNTIIYLYYIKYILYLFIYI